MELLTALISGLLALLGGFLGARFTRDLEYKKWLRQERSLAFKQFTAELHAAWLSSSESRRVADPAEADDRITERFLQLEPAKNIARLFLEPADRDQFSNLVHEIWVAQSSTALSPDTRAKKTATAMLRIQHLFERRLQS